jgi:pimeloyl-ACP methyl ester carboxylesterase
VNYIAAGPPDAQPFLLIHGFGASGFHWRRNVNVLAAAGYRVYAIDLIGFGLSSKPVMEYDSRVWREQCAAFLREVAGCGKDGKKAIVAGNSIGGYTALAVGAEYPDLTLGVASLNGAGSFSPSPEAAAEIAAAEAALAERNFVQIAVDRALEAVSTSLQRFVAYIGLLVTKQPLRIKTVLRQVYTVSPEAADDELVESIVYPAEDSPGLAPPGKIPEVFFQIVSRNARGGNVPVDDLIGQLKVPLLLLWGEKDPWVVSAMGDRAQAFAEDYGVDVRRVSVDAGHCPQDEAPEAVNKGLLDFAREIA